MIDYNSEIIGMYNIGRVGRRFGMGPLLQINGGK